jgi:oxygen-independent coproporphyrinogen-3 oxidase
LQEIIQRKNELIGQNVATIYFGGGTPSILKPTDLQVFIDAIRTNYSVMPAFECTLEANPDDISADAVSDWIKAGVNRLSVGIQSFDEADLNWMNRAHTAEEGMNCIRIAQEGGIQNISLDLMYGLPNMDNSRWLKQIQHAIDLNVQHISAYCLTVEEKTALHQLVAKQQIIPASNELQGEQFETLVAALQKAGFFQYEISNFAQAGYISNHNSNYWKGVHYLGIGPSAHSFDGISRAWNVANNQQYMRLMKANLPVFEREILTQNDQFNELLLTGLRTCWGVDLQQLSKILSPSEAFWNQLTEFEARNWLHVKDHQLILTEAGKLWADKIAQDLFVG